MSNSQVVFLAGGTGERFKTSNGPQLPKPLIDVLGLPQIVWAIKGALLSYPDSRFFLAARSSLIQDLNRTIEDHLPRLVCEYVDIGDSTRGAAESLFNFVTKSDSLDLSGNLISCDNDCFNLVEGLSESNFLSVAYSENPQHCFLIPDQNGDVREIHEKAKVSTIALSGNYGFSSANLFKNYYLDSQFSGKEKFLSSVVQTMVNAGVKFRMQKASFYYSFGTPDEISSIDSNLLRFS